MAGCLHSKPLFNKKPDLILILKLILPSSYQSSYSDLFLADTKKKSSSRKTNDADAINAIHNVNDVNAIHDVNHEDNDDDDFSSHANYQYSRVI